jgi:hypothetical protein
VTCPYSEDGQGWKIDHGQVSDVNSMVMDIDDGSAATWSRSATAQYIAAIAIGLTAAFVTFPDWYFLGALPVSKALPVDVAQHVVSQRYFIADTWHWPILRTILLKPPGGVNIGLTDGIPLEALVLKLFKSVLPTNFDGVALWVVIAAVAQSIAAIFAIRGVGKPHFLTAVACAVIAVCVPFQLLRWIHAALGTHAVLLLAIGTYLRIVRAPSLRKIALAALLPMITLLIHPYLAAMTIAVLAAVPISLAARNDSVKSLTPGRLLAALVRRPDPMTRAAGYGLLGALALCLATTMLLGYFGGAITSSGGFGDHAMDLFGPIIPTTSGLLGRFGGSDLSNGNAADSQYMGVGVLFLAVIALVSVFRHNGAASRLLHDHIGIVLVSMLLYIFSILHNVAVFGSALFTIPIPWKIMVYLEQFRGNDRFFWPVSYCILIGSVLLVSRIRPTRLALVLLMFAAGLEVADSLEVRQQVTRQTAGQEEWRFDPAMTRPVLATHSDLAIWPPADCTNDRRAIMDALLLGSEIAIPASTMLLSRSDGVIECNPVRVLKDRLRIGELLLIVPPAGRNLAALVPDGLSICRSIGTAIACSEDIGQLGNLHPMTWDEFRAGDRLSFGYGERGLHYLEAGWAPDAQKDGIWTEGSEASLLGMIPPGAERPTHLFVTVKGYSPVVGGEQTIQVLVGETVVTTAQAPDLQPETFSAKLPPMDASRIVQIRFRIAQPTQPASRRERGGTVERGMFLQTITFE